MVWQLGASPQPLSKGEGRILAAISDKLIKTAKFNLVLKLKIKLVNSFPHFVLNWIIEITCLPDEKHKRYR
jgi:hypothetical protein